MTQVIGVEQTFCEKLRSFKTQMHDLVLYHPPPPKKKKNSNYI